MISPSPLNISPVKHILPTPQITGDILMQLAIRLAQKLHIPFGSYSNPNYNMNILFEVATVQLVLYAPKNRTFPLSSPMSINEMYQYLSNILTFLTYFPR